jgi:Protein of unknown function (DUF1579)
MNIVRAIFLCSLVLLGAATAGAQDMEDAMKSSLPGPEHDVLKLLTGKWKSTITVRFDPSNPVTGKGSTTNRMILGGRFLQMEGEGTVMGVKAANMQILGYDNRKGKYFSFSIDELGTYAVTAQGDYDAATKTITLSGVEEQGEMKMNFRFLIKIVDKNKFNFNLIFDIPGQGEMTIVEGVYTRA